MHEYEISFALPFHFTAAMEMSVDEVQKHYGVTLEEHEWEANLELAQHVVQGSEEALWHFLSVALAGEVTKDDQRSIYANRKPGPLPA